MADIQIMIVEDENIVAKDIQNCLKGLGYGVPAVVPTGKEAIKKAVELQPDLVLMDIKLEGDIDGVEAAEQIRSKCDIPVVYLTAFSDEKTLQRAKITEPYGYIIKPFEQRELHSTVEMALYKHKMEKKLKDSEKWLSTVLKSVDNAVIATDMNGQVTLLNPVAESLTGWKEEESIGKSIKDFFNILNENTLDPVEGPLTTAMRKGIIVGLANHILMSKSGTTMPIADSAAPIRNEKGKIVGGVLVFRDITDRKRAEEELRESEERYRSLITNIPDVTWTTDGEGNLKFISPNIERIYGYTRQEIYRNGTSLWFKRIHPDDVKKVKKAYNSLFEKGKGFDIEYRIKRKDGEWIWLHDRSITTYEKNGTRYADGIFSDVTDRKLVQKVLKNSGGKLKKFIDSSPDAATSSNPDGDRVKFNIASLDSHDYSSKEEVVDKDALEIVGKGGQRKALGDLKRSLEDAFARSSKYTFLTKNGRKFPAELSTSFLRDASKKSASHMGTKKGITERKAKMLLKQYVDEIEMSIMGLRHALDELLKRVDKKHEFANERDIKIGIENRCGIFLYPIQDESSAYSTFLSMVDAGLPTLAVARASPDRFKKSLGRNVETVWLTTNRVPGKICVSPLNITALSMVLTEFFEHAPEGVVLFKGVEYMLSIVGFKDLLSLLQLLNDKIALGSGAIYVIIDMNVLNRKDAIFLQRECLTPPKIQRGRKWNRKFRKFGLLAGS